MYSNRTALDHETQIKQKITKVLTKRDIEYQSFTNCNGMEYCVTIFNVLLDITLNVGAQFQFYELSCESLFHPL